DARPLRVEMRLGGFEDRFEHRERVERVDGERNADEFWMTIACRRIAALREKRPQRVRRRVVGGMQRENRHDFAGGFSAGAGRGKSTSAAATFAPVSFAPQTSSSRHTGPG